MYSQIIVLKRLPQVYMISSEMKATWAPMLPVAGNRKTHVWLQTGWKEHCIPSASNMNKMTDDLLTILAFNIAEVLSHGQLNGNTLAFVTVNVAEMCGVEARLRLLRDPESDCLTRTQRRTPQHALDRYSMARRQSKTGVAWPRKLVISLENPCRFAGSPM